jgi:hypothetical protein
VSPKRGDDVAPPPIEDEWRLVFATSDAAKGWGCLCAEAVGNTRRCFEALRRSPDSMRDPDRQHRLRGRLATAMLGGRAYPQWEYEVTAGGRVRYLVDDSRHTVHLVYASTATPKTPTVEPWGLSSQADSYSPASDSDLAAVAAVRSRYGS